MTPSDVRAARKRMGMTQSQFAEACDLGKGGARVVRGWEKGEYVPGRRSRQAIERLLQAREEAGTNEGAAS